MPLLFKPGSFPVNKQYRTSGAGVQLHLSHTAQCAHAGVQSPSLPAYVAYLNTALIGVFPVTQQRHLEVTTLNSL